MIERHFDDSADVSAYVLGPQVDEPGYWPHHPHAPSAAKALKKRPVAAIIVRPQPVSMDP